MSDDLLRDAARALGASASRQPAHADETRARIMATLRRQRARRLGVIRAAIPLAAVLVGSIAWAAATGRLAASFRAIVPALGSPPSASEAAPPAAVRSAARTAEVAAPIDPASTTNAPSLDPAHATGAPPLDPARPTGAPPPDLAPSPEITPASPAPTAAIASAAVPTGAAARSIAPAIPLGPNAAPDGKDAPAAPARAAQPAPIEAVAAPPPAALPPLQTAPIQTSNAAPAPPSSDPPSPPASSSARAAAPAAPSPDEIALYETAHRIHFVDRNPTAALAAWDTYLRAAPRGRFAVEAQYNRALCLVRVGRTAEAEKVLLGFARGAYGGYRRTEAQNLLDAMGSPAP